MIDPMEWDMAGSLPEGLSPPLQALWWLRKGGFAVGPEWERAHAICQSHEGEPAHDLAHAVAHLVEGDLFNADYWFRRAGHARRSDQAEAEWRWVAAELAARG